MYGFVGWLFGWLVDWLFGWLVGCKIHQVGGRKSVKLGIKTIKLEPKIVKNLSQEGSWRGLGGSWGALGLILAPRQFQEPKSRPTDPPRTPLDPTSLGPRSFKNRSRCNPKGDHFLIGFGIDVWSHLAPSWHHLDPQNKSSQVGSKIDPHWSIDLRVVF